MGSGLKKVTLHQCNMPIYWHYNIPLISEVKRQQSCLRLVFYYSNHYIYSLLHVVLLIPPNPPPHVFMDIFWDML